AQGLVPRKTANRCDWQPSGGRSSFPILPFGRSAPGLRRERASSMVLFCQDALASRSSKPRWVSYRLLTHQHETIEITNLADGVVTVSLMQQTSIVPYHRVAGLPFVAIFKARLR